MSVIRLHSEVGSGPRGSHSAAEPQVSIRRMGQLSFFREKFLFSTVFNIVSMFHVWVKKTDSELNDKYL